MGEDFTQRLPYGLNNLPALPPDDFNLLYPPTDLAMIGMPRPLGYKFYAGSLPTTRADALQLAVGTNAPKTSGSRFSNENILEIAAKKGSPTLRCVKCGAPTAGTYYPYCPDCYTKSLDPKGGVPPIPLIIDPLKQME